MFVQDIVLIELVFKHLPYCDYLLFVVGIATLFLKDNVHLIRIILAIFIGEKKHVISPFPSF